MRHTTPSITSEKISEVVSQHREERNVENNEDNEEIGLMGCTLFDRNIDLNTLHAVNNDVAASATSHNVSFDYLNNTSLIKNINTHNGTDLLNESMSANSLKIFLHNIVRNVSISIAHPSENQSSDKKDKSGLTSQTLNHENKKRGLTYRSNTSLPTQSISHKLIQAHADGKH